MKKHLYSIGGIIILLIAAFIFVLVPAMSADAGRTRLPAYGSYDGVPIKFEENSEFYNVANQFIENMQRNNYDLNSDMANFYYTIAFSQAFSQVVGPMALRSMARESGWTPSDCAIDRDLITTYYSEAGKYSQALYNSVPDETKRRYAQETEQVLAARHTYEDLFGTDSTIGGQKLYGLKTSEEELEFLRKMGEAEYSFDAVSFNMADYPQEEIVSYGNSRKDLFVKYDLSVITVQDESKAKNILRRLQSSEISFDDAITEYSDKSIGDGETGKITQSLKYQIQDIIADQAQLNEVLSLSKDAISGVVSISSGFAIFRCDGNTTQPDFSNNETIAEANTYLFNREKSHVEDYWTAKARDFINAATTTSFDEEAQKEELVKTEIPAFALNYNNTTIVGKSALEENQIFKAALTNENFLKIAFSLKAGDISSPVVLPGTNTVIVLHAKEITKGGTPKEDAARLIGPEIVTADSIVVNSAIQNSPKIKNNSAEFFAVFNGEKS